MVFRKIYLRFSLKTYFKKLHSDLPWPRGTPKSELASVWSAKDCEGLAPIVRGGEKAALSQVKGIHHSDPGPTLGW